MTLSALKSEIAAVRLHGLTETNVSAVEVGPSGLLIEATDRDADALDALREDLDASETACKETEAERDELQLKLDALTSEQMDAADREEEIGRFRKHASDWAKECEAMRRELTALRKRKGIEVALLAHWRDAWQLVSYVAKTEGLHREQAQALAERILLASDPQRAEQILKQRAKQTSTTH